MAPPYAITFMDSLKEDILSNSLLKPLVWWRYIELQTFLEAINSSHPNIQCKAEYSRAKINFLDVTVMKKSNQLVTDLHVQRTDTHQYLHGSSCHVSHCIK